MVMRIRDCNGCHWRFIFLLFLKSYSSADNWMDNTGSEVMINLNPFLLKYVIVVMMCVLFVRCWFIFLPCFCFQNVARQFTNLWAQDDMREKGWGWVEGGGGGGGQRRRGGEAGCRVKRRCLYGFVCWLVA